MGIIRGFFFDLDGTLVDTYEADYLAYRQAILDVLGVTIKAADFYQTNGLEMRAKLDALTPGYSDANAQAIAAAKKLYYPNFVYATKANAALVSFLRSVAPTHHTALVTTAKRHNAQTVLEHHRLSDLFAHTVFGDEVTEPKPSPAPYILGLQKSQLTPGDVVAFEDTLAGVQSATAAGIATVRVGRFS